MSTTDAPSADSSAADHPQAAAPRVIDLDSPPDLLRMYGNVVKGMLPGFGGGASKADGLPDTTLRIAPQQFDLGHIAEYAEVCGFRLTSALPPTYLFCQGLAGALKLMTASDFPYSPLGSVHLANTIVQHRPIGVGEPVAMTVSVENLRPHRRGMQMDGVMVGLVDDGQGEEEVWRNTATFLVPGKGDEDADREASTLDDLDAEALPLTGLWRVPADIGRRYGAISGDRNPIHISALTAKPLGFDKAIAHGMWTAAKAVAGLEGRIPDACEIEVRFIKPLSLPRTVEYATQADGDTSTFTVRSPGRGQGEDAKPAKIHLIGEVRPR